MVVKNSRSFQSTPAYCYFSSVWLMKISFKRESKCSLDFTCELFGFLQKVSSAMCKALKHLLGI